MNPYYDPTKPHHTREGFKNNYTDSVTQSFSALMRWQWEKRQQGLPRPPAAPISQQAPAPKAIQAYAPAYPQNPRVGAG